MTTSNLDFLAGVGSRKITQSTQNISPQELVGDRYRGMMKAQMQAVTASLLSIISDIKGVTADILYAALEPTMEKAKEYCPKKTGALVDSAYMDKLTYDGGGRVVMGFSKGGVPDYGVLVHEITTNKHEYPTRSKFLLAAIEEDSGAIYERILRGFKLP